MLAEVNTLCNPIEKSSQKIGHRLDKLQFKRVNGQNLPHLLIEIQIQLVPMLDKVKAMDNFHMVQQITCHWVGGWTIEADLDKV